VKIKRYLVVIIKTVPFLLLLTSPLFLFNKCAPDAAFEQEYWKNTNEFYMVFDMTKRMDDIERLSFFEMIKISSRRTRMAKELLKNNSLIGLSKEELVETLGEGHRGFVIGGDYNNSMQYVIDAYERVIQFYGESGIRNKYLMVFFNDNDRVSAARIADGYGKFE
jgi:hypothetical protein